MMLFVQVFFLFFFADACFLLKLTAMATRTVKTLAIAVMQRYFCKLIAVKTTEMELTMGQPSIRQKRKAI